jgi:hypothetical protein
MRKNRVCVNLTIDSIMVVIILSMALANRDVALKCDTPIFLWLMIFSGICLLRVIKNLIMAGAVPNSTDPLKTESHIDMLYCCTVLNFEFAWLIYGNTFHWGADSRACMTMTDGTRSLWILMTIVLIYGYAVFLMYSMIFLATLYVIVMQLFHRRHVQEDHPVVQRVPYMTALRNIRREPF